MFGSTPAKNTTIRPVSPAISRFRRVRRENPKRFRRLLLAELLEARRLLSVTPLNVALVSDAITQAEQIRNAAAENTFAILSQTDSMTVTGLIDLLASVSAAHDGAPIGHLGIVPHGSPGEVNLGRADELKLATVPSHVAALERSRSVLTSDAGLDLYICSVPAEAAAKSVFDRFALVMGAAVLASDNAFGTVSKADFTWAYWTSESAARKELFSVQEIDSGVYPAVSSLCE